LLTHIRSFGAQESDDLFQVCNLVLKCHGIVQPLGINPLSHLPTPQMNHSSATDKQWPNCNFFLKNSRIGKALVEP
jgi:hypothetical protein